MAFTEDADWMSVIKEVHLMCIFNGVFLMAVGLRTKTNFLIQTSFVPEFSTSMI